MTLRLLQADPFPDPTHAGQEIENIGVLFAHITVILFLSILMIYLFVKFRKVLPMLVVYLFSLVIGMMCLKNPYMPFTPYFTIFFLLFQTSLFIEKTLDMYNKNKK